MSLSNDSVSLIDQAGQKYPATVIHVFSRDEVEGWGDDADPSPSFHLFALMLFQRFSAAQRVMLATVRLKEGGGKCPLYLVEVGTDNWIDAGGKPVRVRKTREAA